MTIGEITQKLEQWAPPFYQESYDNCGLITGNKSWDCTGIITTLDATEAVLKEAVEKKCNLIVAHHPIVFQGLKKINGNNYVERAIIFAIQNNLAIYAIHTNLDNVLHGVNQAMANKIGLVEKQILAPKPATLSKLFTYVPTDKLGQLKDALFEAGAGQIGNYSECSFSTEGEGSFKPAENAQPYIGQAGGPRENVPETKLELVFPAFLQNKILDTLFKNHPYETVAYEIIKLENINQDVGSGIVGRLPKTMNETEFLYHIKNQFSLAQIRHTQVLNKPIRTVAICGGAGSFLIKTALASGADAYITSDIKYHEFFDAEDKMLLLDIGHWETEQFTMDLLHDFLRENFPNFAVQKTEVNTNPVYHFL